MYKESDHDDKRMPLVNRLAWMAVAFVIIFGIVPGLIGVAGRTTPSAPNKTTYNQPLRCYGDTIVEGDSTSPSRAVLICDPPINGALPTSTPR